MAGYENERQVLEDAAGLRNRIADAANFDGPGPWRQIHAEYLIAALTAAGVELGEYDRSTAAWLASRETSTVQVIARWIAAAAGVETKALLAVPVPSGPCEAAELISSTEACEGPADAVRVFEQSRPASEREKELGGTLACRLHGAELYARIDPSRSLVYPNGGKDGRNAGAAIEVYKRAQQIRAAR